MKANEEDAQNLRECIESYGEVEGRRLHWLYVAERDARAALHGFEATAEARPPRSPEAAQRLRDLTGVYQRAQAARESYCNELHADRVRLAQMQRGKRV